MNRVLTLAVFNIKVLLSERTWFFLAWALFGLQLAVYGSLMSRLIGTNLPDYFYFYGVGLMIIIFFDTAADVGRHFVEHAHEGELPYFLSLPVSRKGFLAAQAIYGVVNTLVKVAPPLLAVLFFWGRLTFEGAFFAIISLFILGLGISGIMISMSFIAFKSVDIYSAVIAGLISVLSPLTYGADLTRWILGFDPHYLLNPLIAAAVVTAVAIGTLSLSTRIVDRIIEGVKTA